MFTKGIAFFSAIGVGVGFGFGESSVHCGAGQDTNLKAK